MDNKNNMYGDGIPMGFGMALAQNTAAFKQFSAMSPEQKQKVIDGVHGIQSKEEMRAYVSRMADGGGYQS